MGLERLESRRLLSISGDVLTDDIYPVGDKDEHFFSVIRRNWPRRVANTWSPCRCPAVSAGFSLAPRCNRRRETPIGSEIDAGSSQTFKLTVAGNYVVKVQDNDDRDTGTYVLALEGIRPPSLDAQAITLGERKQARLDVMGEVDEYTFTATAGNIVTLSLSETHLGSRATLFSPAGDKVKLYSALTGNRVSEVTAGSKALSEPLPAGTYVIQVYDDNYTAIGNYQLSLEGLVPASADAVAITLGETKSGDIVAGEVDAYKFTATGGNVVTVSLSDAVSGTSFQVVGGTLLAVGEQSREIAGHQRAGRGRERQQSRLPAARRDGNLRHPGLRLRLHASRSLWGDFGGTESTQLGRHRDRLRRAENGNDQPQSEIDAFNFTVSAADLAAGGGQYLAKLSLSSETTVDYKPRSRVYSPSGETVGAELDPGDTKL